MNTFPLNQQVGQQPGCSGVPREVRAAAPSPLLLPQQKPPLIPRLLVQQVCNTSTTDIHPFPSPSSSWEYSGFTASGERAAGEILLVMSRWDCAYSHQLLGKNQRKPNLLSFSKGLRTPHHHSAALSVCCRSVTAPRGKPRTQPIPELHGNQAQQPSISCSFHWGKRELPPSPSAVLGHPTAAEAGRDPGQCSRDSAPASERSRMSRRNDITESSCEHRAARNSLLIISQLFF